MRSRFDPFLRPDDLDFAEGFQWEEEVRAMPFGPGLLACGLSLLRSLSRAASLSRWLP